MLSMFSNIFNCRPRFIREVMMSKVLVLKWGFHGGRGIGDRADIAKGYYSHHQISSKDSASLLL